MKFNNAEYIAEENESVLDLLLRHEQDVSYSCKSGCCQSCLLKSLGGDIDPAAQKGLKTTFIAQNYFLACQQPANKIDVACLVDDQALFSPARLIEKHFYNDEICRLRLEPSCSLYYHAGQFINLRNTDGVSRSYSLASLISEDSFLELHVRRKNNGVMSNWIFDEFTEGHFIDIQGPIGECFYANANPQETMVLIGSGTGAAPLVGIARDAIYSGHTGEIHFYHGAREPQFLYLHEELTIQQQKNSNFFYHPCVSSESAGSEFKIGRCNEIALSEMQEPKMTSVFLCGNPDMVNTTRKKAFLSGVAMKKIYVDPFEYKDRRKKAR